MIRDPKEFRQRYNRWKCGKPVYQAGRPLPTYDDGNDITTVQKQDGTVYNVHDSAVGASELNVTTPEVVITGTDRRPAYLKYDAKNSTYDGELIRNFTEWIPGISDVLLGFDAYNAFAKQDYITGSTLAALTLIPQPLENITKPIFKHVFVPAMMKVNKQMFPVVRKRFAEDAWKDFLLRENGNAYYRFASDLENGTRSSSEKYFVSHTTPWKEFYKKYLYKFPNSTFGKRKATNEYGFPGDRFVDDEGRLQLLYGLRASGKYDKMRIISDKDAELLEMDPYVIGLVDRPRKPNGFYDTSPRYDDIHQGNLTVVSGSELNDAILNTQYEMFYNTPNGVQKIIHVPK